MSLWRVVIWKAANGEAWSNRYYVDAATPAAAALVADDLINFEQQFHATTILFERYTLSTASEDGRVYSSTPIAVYGLRSLSGTELLPYDDCLDVICTIDGMGDPGRKYYHCGVTESDQNAGALRVDSGYLIDIFNAAATTYLSSILGANAIRLLDGTSIVDFVAELLVGNHQFGRKWADRAPVEP
jgi:hypothetical protein